MRRLTVGLLLAGVASATSLSIASGRGNAADERGANNPKSATMAIDPKLQARAKQIVIKPHDLPPDWSLNKSWDSSATATQGPEWSCNGHTPDLSELVVRAAWSVEDVRPDPTGGTWQVSSIVFFLASVQQARALFSVGKTYYPKYCEIVGKAQGNAVLHSLSHLSLPRVADEQAGFRTVLVGSSQGWGDLILLQRRDVSAILTFGRANKPFPRELENAILKKFASRLHR